MSIFRLTCCIFLELDTYSILYLYEQCRLLGPSELQFFNQFSVKNNFCSVRLCNQLFYIGQIQQFLSLKHCFEQQQNRVYKTEIGN